MNLGIYSKTEMAGGSEFRCVEMANAIVEFTEHKAFIFTDSKTFPSALHDALHPKVELFTNAPATHKGKLYEMDHILVVNTDSKEFTTLDYWQGKTNRHDQVIELKKINSMSFLFNFIVSPAKHLNKLNNIVKKLSIITTNQRYFDELSDLEKHEHVRTIPRLILESPIDQRKLSTKKFDDEIVRIGKHSHALGNKFSDKTTDIIKVINRRHKNVIWDFMGVPDSDEHPRKKELQKINNVIIRDTFSLPVNDYLEGIDIFFFNISKNRIEPSARAVTEAMLSACPIVAWQRDGGIQKQVVHKNNGFLFNNENECIEYLSLLIENETMRKQMGRNSQIYARDFCSDRIIEKYMRHVNVLMEVD